METGSVLVCVTGNRVCGLIVLKACILRSEMAGASYIQKGL